MYSYNLIILLIITTLGCGISVSALANAWTQKKGATQIINQLMLTHSQVWDENGKNLPYMDLEKMDYKPYFEHGVKEKLTLGGSLYFMHRIIRNERDDRRSVYSKLNFAEVFLRKKIISLGNLSGAHEVTIKIPVKNGYSNSLQTSGGNQYDVESKFAIGYGFPATMPFLLSYAGQSHFILASLAYRHRVNNPFDEVRGSFSMGLRPRQDMIFMGEIFTINNVDHVSPNPHPENPGNRNNLVKTQVSFIKQIDNKYSLQFGIMRDISGTNSRKEKGMMLSMWVYYD